MTPTRLFDKGGVSVAVLGEAFAYTPVANPRWMIPKWTFGIREEDVRATVAKARKEGAQLVVLLSHNGFDCDRKMAARVEGIDVILTAHTHDALPVVTTVGKTLLVASGSDGKFLSRLDLDVRGMDVVGYRYKLIPLFADAIAPTRRWRRRSRRCARRSRPSWRVSSDTRNRCSTGAARSTAPFDDLICAAIMAERDAEIALSPGFRWGTTMLPDTTITVEDIHNATAMTYPQVYRSTMSGARLKAILEDVADNLFNPDPYYQQGGDMVRCGGLGYRIDVKQADRTAHLGADPISSQASRSSRQGLHRRRLGERARECRGPAGVGSGRALRRARADRADRAQYQRQGRRAVANLASVVIQWR